MSDLSNIADGMTSDKDKVSFAIALAKSKMVDFIWKAANVEGLGTTFDNTSAILNNHQVLTTRDEVLFILNMRDAWKFLLGSLIVYNNSWMLIREFNKIVGRDLIYGSGELRMVDVYVGGTSWKPSMPYMDTVHEKIWRLNGIEDPVNKALEYFLFLVRAQLFVDGNKRVAQLMANKILVENGIGILSIPTNHGTVFRTLLIQYYETGNGTELKKFLKEECITKIE